MNAKKMINFSVMLLVFKTILLILLGIEIQVMEVEPGPQ